MEERTKRVTVGQRGSARVEVLSVPPAQCECLYFENASHMIPHLDYYDSRICASCGHGYWECTHRYTHMKSMATINGNVPLLRGFVEEALDFMPFEVAPGAQATCVIQPKEVFRADYVVIERPKPFIVLDFRVGYISQWRWREETWDGGHLPPFRGDGVPAEILNFMAAARLPMRLDTCQTMTTMSLVIRNISPEPVRFAGKLVGWTIAEKVQQGEPGSPSSR